MQLLVHQKDTSHLEALAVAHGFNPEGGTKNYVFSTHDTHSELYRLP